ACGPPAGVAGGGGGWRRAGVRGGGAGGMGGGQPPMGGGVRGGRPPEITGLAAARLWATDRFPYLATGLFGAEVIAAADSGTVSVDEDWRMHAGPDLGPAWTPPRPGSLPPHPVLPLPPA